MDIIKEELPIWLSNSEMPAIVQAFSTRWCEKRGKPAIVQAFWAFSSWNQENASKTCIIAGIFGFWAEPSPKGCIIAGIMRKSMQTSWAQFTEP
ncbi:hypothetical protein HQN90_25370 [Paenibacillus alba]|nr:hypothetical protein [Paenibacillus alba]